MSSIGEYTLKWNALQSEIDNATDNTSKAAAELELDRLKQSQWGQGTFGALSDTAKTVDSKIADTSEKTSLGEINPAQTLLRAGGIVGGVVGDVNEQLFDNFVDQTVPQFAQNAVGAAFKFLGTKALESKTGQATIEFLAQHPEALEDTEAALNLLELTPYTAGVKRGINGFLQQVRTKIKDFYSNSPTKKVEGLIEATGEAVVPAIQTAFSPQRQAEARMWGTGANRLDEAMQTGAGTRSDVIGNMNASGFIATQNKKAGTLATENPVYQATVRGTHKATDTDGIVTSLRSDYPEVPESVAKDMWQRSSEALNQVSGKLERIAKGALDPFGFSSRPSTTNVIIRDRSAPESSLWGEATGSRGQTSRVLARLRSKGGLDEYTAAFGGAQNDPDTVIGFIESAMPFERGPWLGRIKDNIPATYASSPGKAHKEYLNAKQKKAAADKKLAAGEELTSRDKLNDNQEQLIATVDAALPKLNRERTITPDGMIRYRASYTSEAKDLGGVGIVMTIDPKTQTVYSMIVDGHDLFGANPVGGESLWNATPIQISKYGTDNSRIDMKKRPEGVAQRQQEGFDSMQGITGIAPNKGESGVKYVQRVREEYKPKANWLDYANVGKNVGTTGLFVSGSRDNSNEQ